jgi:hypothetical protein
MSGRDLVPESGGHVFEWSAVETGRDQFVQPPLEYGLTHFRQQEDALARHDLDAKMRFETRTAQHEVHVLRR